MKAKDKSLERAKKSTLKMAEILGKEVSKIPGTTILYEGTKLLFEHARGYMQERSDARILEFHRTLLYGEGDISQEKWDKLYEKEFSAEDYSSLLNNAVQDEEDAKVRFYVRLFEAIVYEKLHTPYKLPFIKAIRQVSCEDIEMMRYVYIASHYRLKGSLNKKQQIEEYLDIANPVKNISRQNLLRLGFFTMGQNFRQYKQI